MKSLVVAALLVILAVPAHAAALPGFRPELLGSTSGFVSSIAVDSHGILYYTTTNGGLFRFEHGQSTSIARVTTDPIGNSGLLGMALFDDRTAVIHYTTPNQTYDVVSKIDLATGAETIVEKFVCDKELPERGAPSEHHGGNPTVAPDGSIFVGIGDYGVGLIAQLPDWNAGKIFRIFPDGRVVQFARGLRNPFDLVWDHEKQRVILADNGPLMNDELHIVTEGGNYGWPFTSGDEPPIDGMTPPTYVFPNTIAPTGMTGLSGANSLLRRGYLLGGFMAKALYYIPDIDAQPFPAPIALFQNEVGFVLDVIEARNGDLYFATGNAIYRLKTPARGDCNGDGLINGGDIIALTLELADGDRQPMMAAQGGSHAGSWGCDANGDSMITAADLATIQRLAGGRTRSVRSR